MPLRAQYVTQIAVAISTGRLRGTHACGIYYGHKVATTRECDNKIVIEITAQIDKNEIRAMLLKF